MMPLLALNDLTASIPLLLLPYAPSTCLSRTPQLGLLGYVTSVDECKSRCEARGDCEGIIVSSSGQYRACHSRRDINIALCEHSSDYDTYLVARSQSYPPSPAQPSPAPPIFTSDLGTLFTLTPQASASSSSYTGYPAHLATDGPMPKSKP